MRSKTLSCITGIALFASLTIPMRPVAQEQKRHKQEHHRYRFIDLGTFGGPESYINPAFTFGSNHQLNRRGAVVGSATTSILTTSVSNGFVCGGLDGTVPFANHAFQWRNGDRDDWGR